jgi:hypothetical protein
MSVWNTQSRNLRKHGRFMLLPRHPLGYVQCTRHSWIGTSEAKHISKIPRKELETDVIGCHSNNLCSFDVYKITSPQTRSPLSSSITGNGGIWCLFVTGALLTCFCCSPRFRVARSSGALYHPYWVLRTAAGPSSPVGSVELRICVYGSSDRTHRLSFRSRRVRLHRGLWGTRDYNDARLPYPSRLGNRDRRQKGHGPRGHSLPVAILYIQNDITSARSGRRLEGLIYSANLGSDLHRGGIPLDAAKPPERAARSNASDRVRRAPEWGGRRVLTIDVRRSEFCQAR